MACNTTREARKPPLLTMLCATPRAVVGLGVRAMSSPTTDPGPLGASTTTSRTRSHSGAGGGHASTTAQVPALAAITASTSQDRRRG